MDELGNKIIVGIVVALLVFTMQSKKVHELIIGLFGATAPSIFVEFFEDDKEEGQFWISIDKCGSKDCYQLYLDRYPQGQFVEIAKLQLGIKPATSPPVAPTPRKDKPIITPAPIIATKTKPKNKGQKIKHYIAYKNGTAFDTKHNLLWMRCSLGQTWTGSDCSGEVNRFEWKEAKKQSSDFAAYSDWRLPTIKELRTLIYCSNGSPDYFSMGKNFKDYDDGGCEGEPNKDHKSPTILQSVFPNASTVVWSSSPVADSANGAWMVHFLYGYDYWDSKNNYLQVRLVRSGQ